MIGAVSSGSSGWAGGSYTPAGRPTAVGGGGFASPGTANGGAPPGVPTSSIIEARNNRGSNIRIPYARLVPMHARSARDKIVSGGLGAADQRQVLVNGKPALEYDGLHMGEVAWILGRRFKSVGAGVGGPGVSGLPVPPGGPDPNNRLDELNDSQRYAHQAYAGLGQGVDRMQRLASQPWVESMIAQKLGKATISLHEILPASDYAVMMDSSLGAMRPLLHGSTALHVNDVTRLAQMRAQVDPAKLAPPKAQGILLLETGPFLRGVQVDTDAVQVPEPTISPPYTYASGTPGRTHAMPRNEGDNCAFAALSTELRRRNIFDWTPDGIVLSKLESPTDEPMKSTELDARQAQLFNVVIQGPAISTTWTSDIRDHKLQCQPMDRVFVCLVADLSFGGDGSTVKSLVTERNELLEDPTTGLAALFKNLEGARSKNLPLDAALNAIDSKMGELQNKADDIAQQGNTATTRCETAKDEFVQKLNLFEKAQVAYNRVASMQVPDPSDPAYPTNPKVVAKDDLDVAHRELVKTETAMDDLKSFPSLGEERELELLKISNKQGRLRANADAAPRAVLTNFRYMRTTSAHLANYSHFQPGVENSRCGLKFGKLSDDEMDHCAEYIVGAWCIGTVIDSAASRSTVGTLVRTAPASMALNVNVNIEWWSGDKLYKHYMDTSGLVLRRGQPHPLGTGVEPPAGNNMNADWRVLNQKKKGAKRTLGAANIDVKRNYDAGNEMQAANYVAPEPPEPPADNDGQGQGIPFPTTRPAAGGSSAVAELRLPGSRSRRP